MDIKSREQRSQNMAAIKGTNTLPEKYLRSELFGLGFRFRKNKKDLPGKPDIWLTKYNTAIFVNGCFWHRHYNCKYAYTPKSRTEFWKKKFESNLLRDFRVRNLLAERNIKCLIIWECTIRQMKKSSAIHDEVMAKLVEFLENKELYSEI